MNQNFNIRRLNPAQLIGIAVVAIIAVFVLRAIVGALSGALSAPLIVIGLIAAGAGVALKNDKAVKVGIAVGGTGIGLLVLSLLLKVLAGLLSGLITIAIVGAFAFGVIMVYKNRDKLIS